MVRLNLTDKHKAHRLPKTPGPNKRIVVWERGNLVKWIKACRADKGSPRFVKFGNELETAHKITGICWGGYNRNLAARTTTFKDIGDDDKRILTDPDKKDWVQVIRKYGSKKTNVELLHNTKGHIDIRLKCDQCYPECIGLPPGVDC